MANAIVSNVLTGSTAILREEINLVRGVKKEVLYISSKLNAIRNVLDDAEMRAYKNKSIQRWLKELEDISYDIDDVIDEWNFAALKRQIEGENFVERMLEVCSFIPWSCLCSILTRHGIAVKIKGIKERLDLIVKEKDDYNFVLSQPSETRESVRGQSTSSIDVSEIHGRKDDKNLLVSKLTPEGAGVEEFALRVVSIVGTGGIGKTTLAQLIYNDDRVKNSFELRIWIYVSDVFDEVKIAKGIVENVQQRSTDLYDLNALLDGVRESISGKRFLLVLDDVWTQNYATWEPFKNTLKHGGPGSKILVTTRSKSVASMMRAMDIHHVDQLSDQDCWCILRSIAFFSKSEEDCKKLEDIGRKITNKCKGLPLAAKVLGSLLHSKDTVEQWRSVFDSEIWELEEAEVNLFPHLFLSYKELSPAVKRCFSYCAIFPKDYDIDVEKLIRMWMAIGYLSSSRSKSDLELRGNEYFETLRMRCYFQDFADDDGRISCKMHDIVHNFAKFLREANGYYMEDSDIRSFQGCEASLDHQIKVYRSLFCQKELPQEFGFITCLRVLSLHECGMQEIQRDIENLIHLRFLELEGIELMVHVLKAICKLYNLQTLYLTKCGLKEIPREIGNLIHLRHLHLKDNPIEELPETICNLHDLRTLNVDWCLNLSRLPEGIHRLVNLRHLSNGWTHNLNQIPRGLEQLTGLRTLDEFSAGRGWSKLGYLKMLNLLSGSLTLKIKIHDAKDVVEAQEAELKSKVHIQSLILLIFDVLEGPDEAKECVRNEVMEALQPPPNLRNLVIYHYKGTTFPGWITSSLSHLRVFKITACDYCSTLPPLWKLPGLEELDVSVMEGLKVLKREFLGISEAINASVPSSSSVVVGFPKLKKLSFHICRGWKEWEDITAEEEQSVGLLIMPCLKELRIDNCSLTELPRRLLRKASSLEHLTIMNCPHLAKRYEDMEDSDWRSLFIPHVKVFRPFNVLRIPEQNLVGSPATP